jgi:hypothetical protein
MNITPEQAGLELARRTVEFTAGKASTAQLTKMAGASVQAIGQLDFNTRKASEEMAKLGSSNISPVINAIIRGEEKWTGDPAYSSLFFYLGGAAVEAARLRSGGQASAAQLHQGAAEEAQKWANINMTPASWEAVAKAMHEEGINRIQTYQDAIKWSQNHFSKGGAGDSTMPGTTPVKPFADPAQEARYQAWKAQHSGNAQ